MNKDQLKQFVSRLIDEDKGSDACRLIDSVMKQDRIMEDMQEAVKSDATSPALSELIDGLSKSLDGVVRQAISVAVGETLLILKDQGVLKVD